MDRTFPDTHVSDPFEPIASQLQSAAAEAASTLERLLKCGDPVVEFRAAKAILHLLQKQAEVAALKKTVRELEKTNAECNSQIERLDAAVQSLQLSRNELLEIKASLINGAFKRPEWVTQYAWDKIVRNNQLETKIKNPQIGTYRG